MIRRILRLIKNKPVEKTSGWETPGLKILQMMNRQPPYSLSDKQKIFARLLAELIREAYRLGYEITLGETYRTKEQAEIYSKTGKGIANSLHCVRLAIDINLFHGGVFLTKTEDYSLLGAYWESLSTPGAECHWGGHFGDGNHFSIGHEGVR